MTSDLSNAKRLVQDMKSIQAQVAKDMDNFEDAFKRLLLPGQQGQAGALTGGQPATDSSGSLRGTDGLLRASAPGQPSPLRLRPDAPQFVSGSGPQPEAFSTAWRNPDSSDNVPDTADAELASHGMPKSQSYDVPDHKHQEQGHMAHSRSFDVYDKGGRKGVAIAAPGRPADLFGPYSSVFGWSSPADRDLLQRLRGDSTSSLGSVQSPTSNDSGSALPSRTSSGSSVAAVAVGLSLQPGRAAAATEAVAPPKPLHAAAQREGPAAGR